jgi:hypothetical protein
MNRDIPTTCPTWGCICPLTGVSPARLVEETFVHCYHCGAELKVGPNGELPSCPCEKRRK